MHLRTELREGPITTASTAVPVWPSPRFSAWRYWIAPFVWVVLNFIASSDLLSSGHTAVMLTYVLTLLHLHVQNIALLNHLLRKLGHFTAYAIKCPNFRSRWLSNAMFCTWRCSRVRTYVSITAVCPLESRSLEAMKFSTTQTKGAIQ